MNNIVVYKMIMAVGLLVLAFSLPAQKPAIDLIPSSHQIRESAAMVDTSFVLDSIGHHNKYVRPKANQEENIRQIPLKKDRRQIGPSIDSLFGKPVARNTDSTRKTGTLSLYIRNLNPVKFFISIIALK